MLGSWSEGESEVRLLQYNKKGFHLFTLHGVEDAAAKWSVHWTLGRDCILEKKT